MRRILVTGALGQIGAELVPALRQRYGADRVVASDLRMMPSAAAPPEGPFEHIDCTKLPQIQEVVRRHDVGAIYHLAALLSAVAEEKPQMAWELNMGGLYRVLEVARQSRCAVFLPSSIGAFGPTTPRDAAPQDAARRRHHRLRRRDLLPGHPLPPLHLFPEARHRPRHDVHARRHRRHHPAHGGGSGPAQARQVSGPASSGEV